MLNVLYFEIYNLIFLHDCLELICNLLKVIQFNVKFKTSFTKALTM